MSKNYSNTYRIAPPTDGAIIGLFEKIAGRLSGSFQVNVGNMLVGSHSGFGSVVEVSNGAIGKQSRNVTRLYLETSPVGGAALEFVRTLTHWSAQGTYSAPSEYENEISAFLMPNQFGQYDNSKKAELFDVLTDLDAFRRKHSTEAHTSDGPSSFASAMASQIGQMADLHTSMLQEMVEFRSKSENQLVEDRAKLATEANALQVKLQEEHESRSISFNERETTLSAREKQVDDRNHMHARRQLRTEISNDLKKRLERPGVSAEARTIRVQFVTLASVGLAALLAYAAYTAWDIHTTLASSTPNQFVLIFLAVRFALPAAGAGGLLLYLLNWLKQLHSEDVRSERGLERYRYDIDRASWSIETILEAQSKEGGIVPAQWIAGATANLFGTPEAVIDHPATDALGSLLNFAAKAEFGPGGPKIELSRGDLKRLSKSAEREAE